MSGLTGWVQDMVESLGAVGVALLVLLENLFPPIPSEIILPFAGFVAGRGEASIIAMIAAATVGSTVGAYVLYHVGAAIGADRIARFVARYGKWFTVRSSDLQRAEAWFDRHGVVAVSVGRCVPLVRSVVSLPAGERRMPMGRFLAATAAGSAVWNTALIGAGAALGARWEQVESYVGTFQYVVVAVVVVAVVVFVTRRLRRRSTTDR